MHGSNDGQFQAFKFGGDALARSKDATAQQDSVSKEESSRSHQNVQRQFQSYSNLQTYQSNVNSGLTSSKAMNLSKVVVETNRKYDSAKPQAGEMVMDLKLQRSITAEMPLVSRQGPSCYNEMSANDAATINRNDNPSRDSLNSFKNKVIRKINNGPEEARNCAGYSLSGTDEKTDGEVVIKDYTPSL